MWHKPHQARLTDRPRRRAVGAGAKHKFVSIDRLLATRGCTVAPDVRLRTLADAVDVPGRGRSDRDHRRHRDPRATPGAAGRKDRDKFVSGKTKQNAVKSMVRTAVEGRLLYCSPARPGSCADITQARQLGLVQLLAGGLADADCQGMGAQTGGRVITPPHRKFKKNAPAWREEWHEQQRKARSSRRIRVEHAIAHLKNCRVSPDTLADAIT
ncbi:transposase family protein [Streptomyces sp. R11]|uniref:Transposase family protein n=1 Tax=Streptomyces sp. R11 TaxID=3238625 RepID=A0AB39NCK3_9ACTN